MNELRGFVRNAGKAIEQRDADIRRLQDELAEQIEKTRAAEAKYEHCKLQAETWAQEARTQQATVREIYALVGASGKGNFHGAEPIRAELASLRSSQAGLLEDKKRVDWLADCLVIEGLVLVEDDIFEIASRIADDDEPDQDHTRAALRELIDRAISSAQLSSQEPDQLGKTEAE